MLQLRDIHKKKIAGLTEYKNLYIESELQSGDKTLCFSYPKKANFHSDIVEECYINTKENEYIVKEKNVGSEYTSFKCILNLEELEGQPFERYASEEQTIDKALDLALAGTGWIVGKCDLKKRRTVRISNCSSLDIIKEIKKIYRCDLVFNTLTKTIDVYEKLGEDRGAYFIDSLNLKDLSIQGNSYDYYTRIIPIGKDDLRISSINNGKDYVENYQYSNKIKTFYWKDDRYTVVENLKEDAEAKLNEISKPYRSYSTEIINLAKLNDKYKNILDYKLGDTITLISKENKFRDKQRIVKITEYPNEHELDTVELANTTLSFEETQTQFQEAADTVNNITTDNGTIDGSTVDNIETKQISDFEANIIKVTNLTAVNAKIHNLEAQNVNITGKLTAVEATIGTLNSNLATIDKLTVTHSAYIADLQTSKANITQLEAVNATIKVLEGNVSNFETSLSKKASIEQLNATNAIIVELQAKKANLDDLNATNATITELKATKADIKDLQATNANITNLNSDLANIKTLVNGNLSSENIQAGGITSDKLTIANGFITNAMIDNLDVSKVNAGDISTSKFRIKSDDGGIEIVGATQQFKDKNNKVRIQMGKDAQGNFNFIIRGEDGTTTLIDHTGIKQKAIADDLIISNMISSDAVGEKQINYNSFVTGFNKDTNTNTLKATKIKLDNQNQTLEVAFNSLKTQSDATKTVTESHSTTINVMQGQISTAINNTQIVKDGQTILLKDDYNRTVQTVNSINSTLGSHTTQINEATGKITSVDTKVNSVQRDLESTKISVSSNSSKITDLNTITKNQSADINVLKNQISLKVEQSDIEKSINNIEIGGVNLVLNSAPKTTGWSWAGTQGTQSLIDESTAPRGKALKAIFTVSGSSGGMHKPPKQRLVVGQKYSWSVWIKASKNITMSLGHEQGGNKEVSLTTEWQKFTHTFIATNREYQSFVFYAKNITINDWYCVHSLKLEDGDKPTSYSEAPEDLETLTNEKISNAKAEIKITTDSINQTVSNLTTTVSTKADNSTVTSVSNKVSSLETNLNSITGKVSNLETSVTTKADKSTTYTKTETDALVKVKTDEINLNLTKNYSSKTDLTDAINNIEIGGRNLLIGTLDYRSWGVQSLLTNEIYKGFRVQKQTADWTYMKSANIPSLELNKQYVASAYLKCIGGSPTVYFTANNRISGGAILSKLSDHVTSEWKRYSVVFTVTSDSQLPNLTNMRVEANNMTGKQLFICGIKLEEGNKATDWTPAPEDFEILTDEKISNAKAEIKITTDAINQTVSNLTTTVSTKADNSTVTNVSNKVSSLETNLNSIKGEVSSLETTTTTISNNVNTVKNTANDALNKANNAQSTANSKEDKNDRVIFARGTGNDYPGNAIVKIANNVVLNGQSRGLNIIALDRINLDVKFKQGYDTFGDSNARTNFTNKIEELNNGDFIIIVTSQDASYPLNVRGCLEKIGATLFTTETNTYREAYALIGKSRLGKGNGIEMFIPKTANDKRYADILIKVNEYGAFLGANSNNAGDEINSLTTEVTTVKSNIATLDVTLKGITQRVSSTESTTVSLTNQVNKAQNDANTANNKIDNLDIGGRNLARKTSKDFTEYKSFTGTDNICPRIGDVYLNGLSSGDDIYISFIYEWENIVAVTGKTPKSWTQGDGDVTIWNAGSFPSFTTQLKVGSGSQKVQYKYTLTSEHTRNTLWHAQIRHDGIQSGTVRWKEFKVEKGNKPTNWSPAPEDIDSAINSIDNKVTTTNNKVASIETNLNSITSRVSNVETTTSNINGQVNNLSTRMNSAEIKLTDSSIINTVSSQFYKKGECDSKYTTQTEFKQTTSNWEFRVTQTGKVNELENSDFGKPDYIWVEEGNTDKVWYEVANWYGGGVPFTTAIRFTDCTNTAAYIRQSFKPKNPKMKTFSVSGYSHYFDVRNTGGDGYPMCHWYVEVRYENNQASYHNFDVREHSGNDAWSLLHWVVNTEVATKGMITQINFYAYKRNTTGDWRTSQLYFHEGDEKLAWRPGGEIYSDTVAIDSKGVTAYHNNGSYSQIGSRGLEHWENGMCKPYHYITDVKIVDARGKCDGTWFTVYLGDYFKGKQCDLAWQMGNIALTYGRCLSGYEVNCRNYNWQAGTVEMSVKVFYKSEWAGGAGYDKDAYAWGKIFIWY